MNVNIPPPPKKMVFRSVAIALGIICIIFAAGLRVGAQMYGQAKGQGIQPLNEQAEAINVNPLTVNTTQGASFNVSVEFENITDLSGFQFELDWDASLLNCTGATIFNPSTWNDTDAVQCTSGIDNTNGNYVGGSVQGPNDVEGDVFTGTCIVANFTFTALGYNTTTTLTLSNLEAFDWDLNDIALDSVNNATINILANVNQTLNPTSNSNVNLGATPVTNWECVSSAYNPNEPDDGNSYVYLCTTGSKQDYYGLSPNTLTQNASIANVTVFFRSEKVQARSTTVNEWAAICVNGTDYSGSSFAMTTNWVTHSSTWTLNPYTNATWTTSDLNALTAGVGIYDANGINAQGECTWLYVKVYVNNS